MNIIARNAKNALGKSIWITTLIISEVGAMLTACVFICFLDPEVSSGAIFLPTVLPIGAGVGLVMGFIAWPFVHYAIRRTRLLFSVPVLYILTVLGSVIFRQSLIGPPLSLLAALVFCRLLFAESGAGKSKTSGAISECGDQ